MRKQTSRPWHQTKEMAEKLHGLQSALESGKVIDFDGAPCIVKLALTHLRSEDPPDYVIEVFENKESIKPGTGEEFKVNLLNRKLSCKIKSIKEEKPSTTHLNIISPEQQKHTRPKRKKRIKKENLNDFITTEEDLARNLLDFEDGDMSLAFPDEIKNEDDESTSSSYSPRKRRTRNRSRQSKQKQSKNHNTQKKRKRRKQSSKNPEADLTMHNHGGGRKTRKKEKESRIKIRVTPTPGRRIPTPELESGMYARC